MTVSTFLDWLIDKLKRWYSSYYFRLKVVSLLFLFVHFLPFILKLYKWYLMYLFIKYIIRVWDDVKLLCKVIWDLTDVKKGESESVKKGEGESVKPAPLRAEINIDELRSRGFKNKSEGFGSRKF